MAKVLFINGPEEGHLNPTLGLVKELTQRGEEVVYFTTEEFRDKIEKTGAIFHSYENFMENLPFHKFDFKLIHLLQILLRSTDIVIPTVLEKTKGETFDYIIHDSMFGNGGMIAKLLKLPSISSVTTFAFKGMQNIPLEQLGSEELRSETEELALEISRKFSVPIPNLEEIFFNRGDLNMVYTSKLFQPQSEEFGEDFVFVGPSIIDRKDNLDFPFIKLKNNKVIYISLGTIVNGNIDFYHTCFKAFHDFPGKVVLSIGKRTDINLLGNIPENFIVKPYVPQLEVLKQADLFITHGGMNSTSEAIYYHVPLVVIPQTSDQPYVAQRVSDLGAGVAIFNSNITSEVLREAAQRVLGNSSFQRHSATIGNSFKAAGGYKQAVDEIFAFKKLHNISDNI
ncbi:macrolide family glycosyltransferase [Metabacillus fastidiosus]|uniref:Glycosyltransferase n=1 Tax=Metabacillus fastidiosus TaxID=1458 RepID=A0ABU6NYC6_9BACI|nr:glycosyltransferase [Metabacillus fastidiosus]